MKVVILAGGYGTRLSEETSVRPKPMVEIGGMPILWHIMKIYSAHGINEFIICLGYKGYFIKEYFSKYFLHRSDVTLDLKNNEMEVLNNSVEPWKITLIDTGEKTMTGGRLKRVGEFIGSETFCFTYGDGVGDVKIDELLKFHSAQSALATVTAVQPPSRFGVMNIQEEESRILSFKEKPKSKSAWINGGYFVLEPDVLDYIDDDSSIWEQEPMETLAGNGALSAYKHEGFWHPMDTLRDKYVLDDMWNSGQAPWKVWK